MALRMEGITTIPAVVQYAANPGIEFPDQMQSLSRDYLLNHTRPVQVKDFLDEDLTAEVTLKPRLRTLRVSWGSEDGIVPVE